MINNSICPRCSAELSPTDLKGLGNLSSFEATNIEKLPTENLETRLFPKFSVLQCHSCKGQLFNTDNLDNVENIYDVKLIEFRKIPKKEIQMEPLYCPVCENKPIMEKVEHERDRKVIMDICPKCKSVWLDRGELDAIKEESLLNIVGKAVEWLITP